MQLMLCFSFVALSAASAGAQATLAEVRKRGILICGVNVDRVGFSAKLPGKGWRGFDVDFCRAVAAAIFGDGSKVQFVPLNAQQRFDALLSKRIDVLSRNTTWTMERDVVRGMDFAGISYFDGQGFMTPVSAGLSSAQQLDGKRICTVRRTTAEGNARRFFRLHGLSAKIVLFDTGDDSLKAYSEGKCAAMMTDRSSLVSMRTRFENAAEHMLLPEIVSKEPLGPVVRQDDPRWRELVQWVLFFLINAEEAGWTSGAASDPTKAASITVPKAISDTLKLDANWPISVLVAVGSYGEIFERNLGPKSALKLERGVNALWTRGGLLYAPPIQ